MVLILDTGPIVAALDMSDPDHGGCARLFEGTREDLVVPSPVLVEVNYWLVKLGGPVAWKQFVNEIARGAYRVEHCTETDLLRAAELEARYADLRLGFIDTAVVALCERLGEQKVATLDRRHFSIVKPAHCGYLELLPS